MANGSAKTLQPTTSTVPYGEANREEQLRERDGPLDEGWGLEAVSCPKAQKISQPTGHQAEGGFHAWRNGRDNIEPLWKLNYARLDKGFHCSSKLLISPLLSPLDGFVPFWRLC